MSTYTVGELASMAGVTVRTLHHYDEVGLLVPSDRTPSGYRIYDEEAVERLRAILTYRELGLSLDETTRAIDHDTDEALRSARDRVYTQIARLERIATSITRSLTSVSQGDTMTPEEKLAVFGDFDPDEHTEEAQRQWGAGGAFEESIRRTATYGLQDWERIQAENDSIARRFVALMAEGIEAGSPEAAALVDEHRAHISRWYYECTPEIHTGLGQMYVEDSRFTDTIDTAGEGLAQYLATAIAARYSSASDDRS